MVDTRLNKRLNRKTRKTHNRISRICFNKKEKMVVDASKLKWKPVEIPDTLDDFGGFYGLEEIDGVEVKVVNGKAQFIAKDESIIKKDDTTIEENADFQEKDIDTVKSIDCESSSSDDDGLQNLENPKTDEHLEINIFNKNIEINENESLVLPNWTEEMKLSHVILEGLYNLGFTKPTEIQSKAIPIALQGNDIMGKAVTGSGKTLAYGIPILEQLIQDKSEQKTIGLIFTPTRELAHQVTTHLIDVGKFATNKNKYAILSLTGGLSIQKQERLLSYEGSARIVVATPGRFLELIEKNQNLIQRFCKIDTLVLDEADRLLQDGHFDDFEKILKYLSKERNIKLSNNYDKIISNWRTMIFSATFSLNLFEKLVNTSWKTLKKPNNNEDELEMVLKHLMTKIHFKSKPIIIETNPEQKVTSKVKESLIECLPTERDLYVYYFVTMYPGTTLVFCNAIESVKKLTCYLHNLKIPTFQIHSSMSQKSRLKSLEKFQDQIIKNSSTGKSTVLVASDVAARGLDIPGINHVIHYHLPRSTDVYIHRSGRTARGNNEGVSIMICSPQEAMGPLRKLRKLLSTKISHGQRKWQKDVPLLSIEPDILSQLRKRSRLSNELSNDELATKSLNKDSVWLKKAANDLDIELSSGDEDKDIILAKNRTKKINQQLGSHELKSIRFELNQLLKQPIRKDLRKTYLTGGLENLADSLVKNKGHVNIVGHKKVDALEMLKKKQRRGFKE